MKDIYLVTVDPKGGDRSYVAFEKRLDATAHLKYANILMDKKDTVSIKLQVISYVESEKQNEPTTTPT